MHLLSTSSLVRSYPHKRVTFEEVNQISIGTIVFKYCISTRIILYIITFKIINKYHLETKVIFKQLMPCQN